jgi:uncharacterized protein YdhG (YjbR/CyaY superfamily)
MTELSPAARAVFDAAWAETGITPFDREATLRDQIAAALRAAADQMSYAGADEAATWLNEIAAELDSANNTRENVATWLNEIAAVLDSANSTSEND